MPKASRRKPASARSRAVSRSSSRPRASSRVRSKSRSAPAAARTRRSAPTRAKTAVSRRDDRSVGLDRSLRELLVRQLDGGQAYVTFAEAIRDLPVEIRGVTPEGAAHSAWQVLEHLRISQWDIVDFSRNSEHRSPQWPAGYWPENAEPPNAAAWDASMREFERELAAMKRMITDPKTDLFAKIDHPEARAHHTLAREAMVLSEHNGYHTAELVMLRRLLGAWPKR